MDFMKVFDQTVRDIKREVNLKVLKVPEIEQKALDATDDEPWGPHGSALSELAQATKKFTECQMIMNVLWTRLTESGSRWRHVYKALTVIEYLIANGSERAVDDILEHGSQISALSRFEYVDPNGKDAGINVRKKAETLMNLLNDKEKIKAVREKAVATRDKYIGLSSTGITHKSSSTSYGGISGYSSSDCYGSLTGSIEVDSNESYRDEVQDGKEIKSAHRNKDKRNLYESVVPENGVCKSKEEGAHHSRNQDSLPSNFSKPLAKSVLPPPKSSTAQANSSEDDYDDFDPRRSSTLGSVNTSSNQVDLFGPSLMDDFMDVLASTETKTTEPSNVSAPEVDLFADASFQSAELHEETTKSDSQGNIDLFAGQPATSIAFSTKLEFSASPNSHVSSETTASIGNPTSTETFDPFVAIPLNNFEGSDPFGAFASFSKTSSAEPSNSLAGSLNNLDPEHVAAATFGASTFHTEEVATTNNGLDKLDQTSLALKPSSKKESFQVKSGIWADSLSRGLIDLNITAPKKVNLADIGIVGELDDGSSEKEKGGLPPPVYMGRAMGAGSGLGLSGFSASSATVGIGSLSQQQFGTFK